MKSYLILVALVSICTCASAQNLPSLLTEKNINATFSITAYDSSTKEWGIAVATNNIYVGNSTIYIQPGAGAFSVIAETDPLYAVNGFEQLKNGMSIKDAIEYTRAKDEERHLRQVAGIDASGSAYAFTGDALKYWQGVSTHRIGKGYVVMGNQLAPKVLDSMSSAFEKSSGTLAQRLLRSITAGQHAGGQINGKQSAALVVKGLNNEWFNQVDLRVDHSLQPFEDLQKLLNYHYGRIRLNQAIYAIKNNNVARGKALLAEGTTLVKGWNGIYGKIAMAHLLLNEEEQAVSIIQQAMKENPKWIENIAAFYCLANHKFIRDIKPASGFSEKDWCSAMNMLVNLKRTQQAIELGDRLIKKYPSSTMLQYQIARAFADSGKKDTAIEYLQSAIKLDASNAEAIILLKELKG